MESTYLCPHCRGAINALENIILSAKSEKNKIGLVLLHEEIGNYSVIQSSSFKVALGEIVDFFCPVCHASLNTTKEDYYANFIRMEESGKESKIIISRKYGDRRTFKITDEKVESYGECARKYMDPEWFLKL